MNIIFAVDPALGRLEYENLTDQARMEIFIKGLGEEAKELYQDEHGSYIDVCEWDCVECDDDDVIVVKLVEKDPKGQVDITFVPPSVKIVRITKFHQKGKINTALLPSALEEFSINCNAYDGSVDLTTLPSVLISFYASWNAFTGSCDLTSLPHELNWLDLSHNKFSGEVSFDSLPPHIRSINISTNAISGVFRLLNPPEQLLQVTAYRTHLSGTAVVNRITSVLVSIMGTNIEALVDEENNEHPDTESFLMDESFMNFLEVFHSGSGV